MLWREGDLLDLDSCLEDSHRLEKDRFVCRKKSHKQQQQSFPKLHTNATRYLFFLLPMWKKNIALFCEAGEWAQIIYSRNPRLYRAQQNSSTAGFGLLERGQWYGTKALLSCKRKEEGCNCCRSIVLLCNASHVFAPNCLCSSSAAIDGPPLSWTIVSYCREMYSTSPLV